MQRSAIDVQALRAELGSRWTQIEVVDETESTNTELLHWPDAADRSVLVAEYQRAGRGRLDRTWTSPPRAGLTFSAMLRPSAPMATWGWLPLLAGVALHEAVVAVTGVAASLKWPNDLLCGRSERKLAGILAQTSGDAVVIGIGLNVSTTADELPVETATSLAQCGATSLDRTRLLVAALSRLDARAAQWSDVGGDAEACGLGAAYRSACSTIGREVAVTTTAGARLLGRAVAVDADGHLQLAVDGAVSAVAAGDVEHLRAR